MNLNKLPPKHPQQLSPLNLQSKRKHSPSASQQDSKKRQKTNLPTLNKDTLGITMTYLDLNTVFIKLSSLCHQFRHLLTKPQLLHPISHISLQAQCIDTSARNSIANIISKMVNLQHITLCSNDDVTVKNGMLMDILNSNQLLQSTLPKQIAFLSLDISGEGFYSNYSNTQDVKIMFHNYTKINKLHLNVVDSLSTETLDVVTQSRLHLKELKIKYRSIRHKDTYLRLFDIIESNQLESLVLLQTSAIKECEFLSSFPSKLGPNLKKLKLNLALNIPPVQIQQFITLIRNSQLQVLGLPKIFTKHTKPLIEMLEQLTSLRKLSFYPLDQPLQFFEISLEDITSIINCLARQTICKNIQVFEVAIFPPSTNKGDVNQDQIVLLYKATIGLIKVNKLKKLTLKCHNMTVKQQMYMSDKIYQHINDPANWPISLTRFNQINISYYLYKEAQKITPQCQLISLDVMTFNLLILLIKHQLDSNVNKCLSIQMRQRPTQLRDMLSQLVQVYDQKKQLTIWRSEYLHELLVSQTITEFNFPFYLQGDFTLSNAQLNGEAKLPKVDMKRGKYGIGSDFQTKFNQYFKRKLNSFSNYAFTEPLETLLVLRICGPAIQSLILDLDQLSGLCSNVVTQALSELNQVKYLILKGKKSITFEVPAFILERNKLSLTNLCVDLPINEQATKHFATLILNMAKLKHLHLTSNTNTEHIKQSQIDKILAKDSLTSIIIDKFPLINSLELIAFSTNLTQLILGIQCDKKQTKFDYCVFIRSLLIKLHPLECLSKVHVKPLLTNSRHFFERSKQPTDQLDKEVMQLMVDILNKRPLEVWNVFYPYKAKYVRTYANQAIPIIFKNNQQLVIFDNLNLQDMRMFYRQTNIMEIDIDTQYQYSTSNLNNGRGDLIVYDNYKYNQTFTSMVPCIQSLILKKKSQSNDANDKTLEVAFDGINRISLQEMVSQLKTTQDFDLVTYIKSTLKQNLITSSDITILINMLCQQDILESLQQLKLEIDILYDIDLLQIQNSIQELTLKQNTIINLKLISFKGTQFSSNSYSEHTGEIATLNFSYILALPHLNELILSHSNILQVITDTEMAALCVKLKATPSLKYLGLAGICQQVPNSRKYNQLLSNLPEYIDKLNISYNILLPKPLIDFILFQVKDLKMTFRYCLALEYFTNDHNIYEERIDQRFTEIAQFIVSKHDILKIRRIQFHSKQWLSLREQPQSFSQIQITDQSKQVFGFATQCTHEFLVNVASLKLRQLIKLEIRDFDITLLAGMTFSDIMQNLLEEGHFKQLQYLGLINVNMNQYLSQKQQAFKFADKIEFMELISGSSALEFMDLSRNNLQAEIIVAIIEKINGNTIVPAQGDPTLNNTGTRQERKAVTVKVDKKIYSQKDSTNPIIKQGRQ